MNVSTGCGCTMAHLSQLAAKQTTRETLDRATADRNSAPSITCAAFVGLAFVAHSLRMIMVLRTTTKNESGQSLTLVVQFRCIVPNRYRKGAVGCFHRSGHTPIGACSGKEN